MRRHYYKQQAVRPSVPDSLAMSVHLIDQLNLPWQMKNLFIRLYTEFGNWEWCRFDPGPADFRKTACHPLVLILRKDRAIYTLNMAFRELGIDPSNFDEMYKLGLTGRRGDDGRDIERLNREFLASIARLQAFLPMPVVRRAPQSFNS